MPRPRGRRPGETQKQALARIKAEIDKKEAEAAERKRQRKPAGAAALGSSHKFKTKQEYEDTERRREAWRKEQEEKRRRRETYGSSLSGYRTTGSRGHGSEYREDYVIDSIINYLISEGYVYDEKSAIAILEAMSDRWLDEVLTEGIGMELARGAASLLAPRGSTGSDINAGAQRIYDAGSKVVKTAGRVLAPLVTPGPRANPSERITSRRPQTQLQRDVAGRTARTLGR